MKKSKKFIVRFILKYGKKYLPAQIYSLILFIRTFKKFKTEINKKKSIEKFSKNLDEINNYEFKYTSQNNEDGIIEYIFNKIPNNKNFVEIGFGFYEFNSLNLIKKGWVGKLIDIDKDECLALNKLMNFFFPKARVEIINKRVLKDNINYLVYSGFNEQIIDFLSLDIDGNDYWVLKELNVQNINVICCEYNNYLGNDVKKTIPYTPDHVFQNDGCNGASLGAMTDLLESKGFVLIAVESSGTNGFFVKKELAKNFKVLSATKSWKAVDRHNSEKQVNFIKNSVKNYKFMDL